MFWIFGVGALLVLVLGTGAMAAGTLGLFDSGADSEPTPADVSVEPDTPPDSAFEPLMSSLQQTTDVPIMLPADLPGVLDNVAVDPNLGGDRYSIPFFREPTEGVVQRWSRAEVYGTLQAAPKEGTVSNEYFEATSVETVEMPDGAEATLRRMEPVDEQSGTQGPFWEGKFEEGNHTYTLILSDDTSDDMARQVLSTMVEVPQEAQPDTYSAQAPDTGNESEEEKLRSFVSDYHAADEREDWVATYSMLSEGSRQEFTEEGWVEKQQALRDASGSPAPLNSIDIQPDETQSDAPATATLNFEDGTEETMMVMVPMVVESGGDDGPKRFLTEEETNELRQVSPGGGNGDLAVEAEEAAGDYYRASGSQDWDYTYDALDSENQSGFTREEWSQKNQWFADQGTTIYTIESVELDETSQEPVAEVAVGLTGEDGSSSVRTTYFVYEDREWKHRFGREETDLLLPGVSFEEFVQAQQGDLPQEANPPGEEEQPEPYPQDQGEEFTPPFPNIPATPEEDGGALP